jgi:hypothetical protein
MLEKMRKGENLMEPILAVGLACIAYVVFFVGVSWLKDIFVNWRDK